MSIKSERWGKFRPSLLKDPEVRALYYAELKKECDTLARIGEALGQNGRNPPIIQDVTAAVVGYYASYGHVPEFYNAVTSTKKRDDLLFRLVNLYGFSPSGCAAAREKLLAFEDKPPNRFDDAWHLYDALCSFVDAWDNCKLRADKEPKR